MPRRQPTLQHMVAFTLLSSQLPRTVTAEDLDAEDVPAECVPQCAPVVQLTARCEAQTTQRFGNLGRRWAEVPSAHDVAAWRGRRRRRKQERMRKRQGGGSGNESDSDSDSSDDEEAKPPSPALAAARQANKACVCEERGFDVAGVANMCAGCIARNGTAVDADEDIKEIIAECGFTTPPAFASTTSTLSITLTSSSTVEVPVSTAPPPMLAPINPSTFSSATTSTPGSRGTPTESVVASATVDGSITPVTVFETPAIETLPPIILPNDQPLRTGVQSGGSTMRRWFRGGIIGGWVVMVILFLGC